MAMSAMYRRCIIPTVVVVVLAFVLLLNLPGPTVSRVSNLVSHKTSNAQSNSAINDTDLAVPTFAYTYDKLAQVTSDLRVVRDPCEDVPLPDGGVNATFSSGTLVLVTGGAGFIGSNLVDRLLTLGYRVRIFDNLYTGFIRNIPLQEPAVEFYFGDILDRAALKEAMAGVEYVYHLAAMSKVVPSLKSPDMARFCLESNALGSWNVLEEARLAGHIKKVIYAASSTFYGNAPAPHQEDMAPDFLTPYASSKFEGEMQMHIFDQLFGVPTVSTRFFMVYGPRQPTTGAYAIVTGVFAKEAADGKPLTIEGDGTHARDFIHVTDIVEGLILAQQREAVRGDVINLGTGTSFSVQDVADLVSKDQIYVAPRENDLIRTLADTCKMKKLLNYRARSDFVTEMTHMVKATMEGNVFAQDWLTTSLGLSAPHLLPAGTPMFAWPKAMDDLGALLLSLQHLVEKAQGPAGSRTRLVTVLPLALAAVDNTAAGVLALHELLLNTVYSLVRFGGVTRYMFAAADDAAIEMCETLNLPCYDVRIKDVSGQALISSLLTRGYDVHFATIGNSYLSSVVNFFYEHDETIAAADIVYAAPQGDFLVRANDRTRLAFETWAPQGQILDYQSIFNTALWPDLHLTNTSFNVQHFCEQTNEFISFGGTPVPEFVPTTPAAYPYGATATTQSSSDPIVPPASATTAASQFTNVTVTESQSEPYEPPSYVPRSSRPLCDVASTQFYLPVGCSENSTPMVRTANATINTFISAQAFHIHRCKGVDYCDTQQLVPLSWTQKTLGLQTGGIC